MKKRFLLICLLTLMVGLYFMGQISYAAHGFEYSIVNSTNESIEVKMMYKTGLINTIPLESKGCKTINISFDNIPNEVGVSAKGIQTGQFYGSMMQRFENGRHPGAIIFNRSGSPNDIPLSDCDGIRYHNPNLFRVH